MIPAQQATEELSNPIDLSKQSVTKQVTKEISYPVGMSDK